MAIAFDAVVESVRTGTEDPYTWTHTPVGTPRAIIVAAVHGASSTDHVSAVTYGGVSMTRIVRATDTQTEPGAAELWFLGASIPTGNQTVSADLASATTDDIQFVSWSYTAGADCEVIDSDSISENTASPTVLMSAGGREKASVCAMYGGGAAPGGTLATGNTLGPTEDLGAFMAQTCYETTPDNADHTIGWSNLASDDLAFVALAFAEVVLTRRARVSWAEIETPNAPRRARVSWAELEAPNGPRRARLSWAELEVPTAPRRARVSWAEFEAPSLSTRRARVSFAELEVPTAPRRALLSWAEFETPNAPRRARVSWAEIEIPEPAGGPSPTTHPRGFMANVGRLMNP